MDIPEVPMERVLAACGNFDPAAVIGEGATGKVYRCVHDGTPLALKRLHLPADSTPAERTMVIKAFWRELNVLMRYPHPRVVRPLSYARDTAPNSAFPFVIAMELLEEGSLADHLLGARGEAPRRSADALQLSALDRVAIALGVATGLDFLHSHEDSAADGGGSSASSSILHRDIKAANIGLTHAGGALVAKLLDFGLARLKQTTGPGTGALRGTLGYIAPEVATGAYTPQSDIYALGCVLLELLSGGLMGPSTAFELEARAIDGGGGVGAVAALAQAGVWPEAAASALAALALDCIHHAPQRRPASMRDVLRRLGEVHAAAASAAGAAPMAVCARCGTPAPAGLRCAAGLHFACRDCVQVCAQGRASSSSSSSSATACPIAGCAAAWAAEDVLPLLDEAQVCKAKAALLGGEALARVQQWSGEGATAPPAAHAALASPTAPPLEPATPLPTPSSPAPPPPSASLRASPSSPPDDATLAAAAAALSDANARAATATTSLYATAGAAALLLLGCAGWMLSRSRAKSAALKRLAGGGASAGAQGAQGAARLGAIDAYNPLRAARGGLAGGGDAAAAAATAAAAAAAAPAATVGGSSEWAVCGPNEAGETWFQHVHTGETTWEEWERRCDEEGDVWWTSRRTGASVWTLP